MFSRVLFLSVFLLTSCKESQGQSTKTVTIGGPCEGCEAIYEYGNKSLKATDTISGFHTMNEKIKLYGTVYKQDGKTPASDIILYFYHTDDYGKYPTRANSKNWERRHGYLRGWVKTDNDGKYELYTGRPASYPNSTVPQHVHVTVKEPNKNEYYIEDYYFDDDPNLPKNFKTRENPRGGSGVVALNNDKIKSAKRNIILGLNIPNYP
jgi:protocatechuate 3,4-dioxygenase beta subunit